jgi:hypothetical protein
MAATLIEWESKSALMAHLTNVGRRYVVVGADAEAPRRFYSFGVDSSAGQGVEIGIVMSGHGIRPSWTISPDSKSLAVGHDLAVTFVDVSSRRVVAVRRLEGVFFEFVASDSPGEIIVWHEIGVAKMNFSGDKLWHVSTDILEECRPQPNGTLVLRQQGDEDELVIDLRTGNRIRG